MGCDKEFCGLTAEQAEDEGCLPSYPDYVLSEATGIIHCSQVCADRKMRRYPAQKSTETTDVRVGDTDWEYKGYGRTSYVPITIIEVSTGYIRWREPSGENGLNREYFGDSRFRRVSRPEVTPPVGPPCKAWCGKCIWEADMPTAGGHNGPVTWCAFSDEKTPAAGKAFCSDACRERAREGHVPYRRTEPAKPQPTPADHQAQMAEVAAGAAANWKLYEVTRGELDAARAEVERLKSELADARGFSGGFAREAAQLRERLGESERLLKRAYQGGAGPIDDEIVAFCPPSPPSETARETGQGSRWCRVAPACIGLVGHAPNMRCPGKPTPALPLEEMRELVNRHDGFIEFARKRMDGQNVRLGALEVRSDRQESDIGVNAAAIATLESQLRHLTAQVKEHHERLTKAEEWTKDEMKAVWDRLWKLEQRALPGTCPRHGGDHHCDCYGCCPALPPGTSCGRESPQHAPAPAETLPMGHAWRLGGRLDRDGKYRCKVEGCDRTIEDHAPQPAKEERHETLPMSQPKTTITIERGPDAGTHPWPVKETK